VLLRMTLHAHAIAFFAQARAVRLVAVAAGDPFVIHPALQEGAVLVHLAADLPVGLVEVGLEQRGQVRVGDRLAVRRRLGELAAARVAARAGVDLDARGARRTALGMMRLRVARPRDPAPLVERHRETAIGEILPAVAVLGPGYVARARSVAGLAADADL